MQEIIQGYRVSPQQKRLWLLQQAGGEAFRAQCAILIEGPLDRDLLDAALNDVVDRHEILRTTFHCLPGMTLPVQVITEAGVQADGEQDLSRLDEREQAERIEEALRRAARLPLDGDGGPTIRAELLRLSEARHMLILILPALCADSTGLCNIAREISRSYAALGSGDQIADEPMQYVMAAEWQNDLFEEEDFEVGKSFWRKHDFSSLTALKLPLGRQPDAGQEFEPARLARVLTPAQQAKVEAVADRLGVSASAFLLTCWHILLGKLTGQSQVTVGAGYNGRSDEEMEEALGLFAKYLPIRSRLGDGIRLGELLTRVNSSAQEVHGWQEWFAWEHLGGLPHDQAATLYFPLCFDFEQEPAAQPAGGVVFSVYEHYACTDRFELKLRCVRAAGRLTAEFHYNSALFRTEEIELLAGQYLRLIESAVDDPCAAIGDLDLLTDQERRRLIVDFNDTRFEFPDDKSIQELFQQQVGMSPAAIAVAFGDDCLTYAELNRRANRLAHRLRKEGIGPGALVPVCLHRSLGMVVALLGVLKSGAAYVPMDPAYPAERLSFMLLDARASLLLTERSLETSFADQRAKVICLDGDWQSIGEESGEDPAAAAGPDDLAYVVYTSGSTGRPKGVMVAQRSVSNLLAALERAVYDEQTERPLVVSLNAPLAFDASVQQLVLLLRGDRVQIIPQEIRTQGSSLLSHLAEHRVDVFDCTPSQLRVMVAAGLLDSAAPAPRTLLVAGEAIDESLWNQLACSTRPVFYNIYGPTECTVDATFCRVDETADRPVIGRPLANYQLYALDARLRPAPIGASGELHIGGAGVARGYLNRPDLTAEKFIPDPFSCQSGGRLYKSGDLGRYLLDGNLEFLGRIDGQVKLRGYRIELGEIESVLAEHDHVRQCAVCVREDEPDDKRVVAYVVAADGRAVSGQHLRQFLQEKLPSYMVPSAFVELPELPMTPSGKLDRAALPAPKANADGPAAPPRDATELYLFHIWSDVLRTEGFGIHDNFFDLGGHSLTAVALSSRVGEVYGEKVSVRTVFDYPTVAQMASYLRQEVAFLPPSLLVPIQPRGTRPPFFCVHAAGGLAHVFVPLARALGPDQPFYAFQSFELDPQRQPSLSLEQMAARYLAEVRRVQPKGPYQIGGWSFGAMVAYEMAQQLEEAGEQVSLLAILDAGLPSTQVDDRPLDEEELQVRLHDTVVDHCVKGAVLNADEAKSMTTSDLIRLAMQHHKDEARERDLAGVSDLTEAHYLGWFRNMVTNRHASMRYRPKPYPGRLTLFRGNNSNRGQDYGWGRWALGGVDVYYTDADHERFVAQPKATALAAQLAACLMSADR